MVDQQQKIAEHNGLQFVPYITSQQIEEQVKRIAQEISAEYRDKNPLFIGILNGSYVFTADLLRNLDFHDLNVEFCKIQSYDKDVSSGFAKQLIGLKSDIKDRNVILIEDIIDSGVTMHQVLPWIKSQNPQSVKITALIVKPDSMKHTDFNIDFIGFSLKSEFLVGYGLDYDEWGRNYRDILVKKEQKQSE